MILQKEQSQVSPVHPENGLVYEAMFRAFADQSVLDCEPGGSSQEKPGSERHQSSWEADRKEKRHVLKMMLQDKADALIEGGEKIHTQQISQFRRSLPRLIRETLSTFDNYYRTAEKRQ